MNQVVEAPAVGNVVVEEMEKCEELIYYCARTFRASQGQEEKDAQPDEAKDAS